MTKEETPLICAYCKRPPDAIKSHFTPKHGMHAGCKRAHDRGRIYKKNRLIEREVRKQ